MPYKILTNEILEQIILGVLTIEQNIWMLVTTNSFPTVLPVSDF